MSTTIYLHLTTVGEEVAVEAMKHGLDDYIIKNVRHLVRLQGAARAVHFQRELLPVIHHRWIPLHTRATNGLVTRIDYADSTYETFTYNSFQQVTTNRLRNGGLLYYGYATNPCTSPPASAPCPPGSTAC